MFHLSGFRATSGAKWHGRSSPASERTASRRPIEPESGPTLTTEVTSSQGWSGQGSEWHIGRAVASGTKCPLFESRRC